MLLPRNKADSNTENHARLLKAVKQGAKDPRGGPPVMGTLLKEKFEGWARLADRFRPTKVVLNNFRHVRTHHRNQSSCPSDALQFAIESLIYFSTSTGVRE